MSRLELSRRRFLHSATAATAGLAIPSWLFAQTPSLTGCAYLTDIVESWKPVRTMMADRYHRLHHCMFHFVRNNWGKLSAAKQADIKALGWDAPRTAMQKAMWDKRTGRNTIFWAITNGSGEDFLYFHRWMIASVDQMLAKVKSGPIEPWSDTDVIPAAGRGCPDEAVPDFTPRFEDADTGNAIDVPWLQLRVKEMKEPAFYWNKLNWWGNDYRDFAHLRTMTLGELGSRLELGVHNQMHIRWSAYPTNGWRLIRDESDFRTKWDDRGYDTLFDEYSSHIGPIFFRLHKWIDNRIEDWAEAQGTNVQRYKTPYGFDWFKPGKFVQVENPWTGAYGFEHPHDPAKRIADMENVAKILFRRDAQAEALAMQPAEEEDREILTIRDLIM